MSRWCVRTSVVAALVSILAQGMGVCPVRAATARLKPVGRSEVVKVQLGGKWFVYHKATNARPVEYSVEGPVTLRILSRNLAPAVGAGPASLRIEIDGTAGRHLSLKARPSSRAGLRGGSKIGVLNKGQLKVQPGLHKVRVYPDDPTASAAIRVFAGAAKKQAVKWVAFAPDTYGRALRLQVRDSETTCYRFMAGEPVVIGIRGPLRLKITTRLDFGLASGLTQAYVIRVVLDGKPSQSFSLKTRASHTATYPELPEITPGLARDFLLNVPAGQHQVSLVLDGTTAAAATAQIQVPQRQLKTGRPG